MAAVAQIDAAMVSPRTEPRRTKMSPRRGTRIR
jgi:hypothetical protein